MGKYTQYIDGFLNSKVATVPEGILATCRPVCKYDMNGNFIEKYYSGQEADKNNVSIIKVSDVVRQKRKIVNGFIFLYEQYDVLPEHILKSQTEENRKIKQRTNRKETEPNIRNRKIIYQYDLTGQFINEFTSINDFRIKTKCATKLSSIHILTRKIIHGSILKFEKYDKLPDDILAYHLLSISSTKKTGLNWGN
jgi:hypothetical protein